MLTRIEKIKNIGSILDIKKITNNNDFEKVNIFYGLNGSGKTTFTSILESLRSNNLDILKGRKSLLKNNDAEIEFKFGDNRIGFRQKWLINNGELLDNQRPKILIFNDEFIKNNIFSEEFGIGHKKSIHRIIFGASGVEMSKELINLRKQKQDLQIKKDKILTQIDPLSFSKIDYIKINITELDEENLLVDEKEVLKKIVEIENLNKIKLKSILEKISITNIDLIKTDDFWEYDINSKTHIEAKKQVDKFKKKYFKNINESESFIRVGFSNMMNEKNCPFCHAKVEDEILGLYKNYFNNAYDKWMEKITCYKKDLEGWNVDVMEEKIKTLIIKNNVQFEYWKEKTNNLLSCDVKLNSFFEELAKIKRQGLFLITNKIDDPNKVIDKHFIHRLGARKDAQLKLVEDYNTWVESQNKFIVDYKTKLENVNLSEVEKEKKEIIDKISRVSVIEIKKCDNYKDVKLKLDNNIKQVDEKVKELNEYTKKIITKYKVLINEKIKDFGCNHFKISEFLNKTGEHANEPYVEIVLKVFNKEINISKSKNDDHSFKNTLSRGEKNSLAFAFFLVFFEEEIKNKEDYILVFDDPLTSSDDNREDDTATEIKKISEKVDQVFILTHKKSFLRRLYRKFSKERVTYIKVEKNSDETCFKEFDINKFFLEKYKKIIDRFSDVLKYGMDEQLREDDLCGDIRHVFEHVLWSKYYELINQNSDVVSHRKQLINDGVLNDIFFSKGLLLDVKTDFIDLCNIGHENNHICDNQLNSEQVKNKIRKTLDIIKKL